MMKLEVWDGRKFQMQDRWILTIGWGDDAQRLATFANREDGQHAFDALTRNGWALLNPDGWVPHTWAMNLARLRGAEVRSFDQELTWTVLLLLQRHLWWDMSVTSVVTKAGLVLTSTSPGRPPPDVLDSVFPG